MGFDTIVQLTRIDEVDFKNVGMGRGHIMKLKKLKDAFLGGGGGGGGGGVGGSGGGVTNMF